jgi:uncharacterized protein (TIGR03066 family)
MNRLCFLAAGILTGVLTAGAPAQDKVAPKLLLGVWDVTKGDPNLVREGSTFAFAKDGTMVLTLRQKDKEAKFEMTYSLSGDKLTCVVKGSKGPGRIVTIKKLTEKELVWEESNGKLIELTRKK